MAMAPAIIVYLFTQRWVMEGRDPGCRQGLSTVTSRELDRTTPDWWRQAVVYQIYPRSFADAERRRHRRPAGHHARGSPTSRRSASTPSG